MDCDSRGVSSPFPALPDPPALAARIEQSIAEGVAAAARAAASRDSTSDLVAVKLAGGWVVAGEGRSPLARAVGLGFDGAVEASMIDSIEALFRERAQAPRFDVCQYATPGLLSSLASRRYVPQAFMSAFARVIEPEERISGAPGYTPPDNLTLRRIDPSDDALVDVAVDVMSRCFHDHAPAPDWLVRVTRQGILQPRAVTFLAYLDDEPVGGGCLAIHEDLAMLFGAGVLPAYRRHGIQGALIRGRLMWARDCGATLATIQSAPGAVTERTARRAGFEPAYTKIVLVGERNA